LPGLAEEIKYSKGTLKNPFTGKELESKFRMLASSLLSEKRVNKIIEMVDALEALEDISTLTRLLKKEGG
jgi:2-methylcitrate dehydratase PrpD